MAVVPGRLRLAADDPVNPIGPGMKEEGERACTLRQAVEGGKFVLGVGAVAADAHAVDGRHDLSRVVPVRAAAADDVTGLEPDLSRDLTHQPEETLVDELARQGWEV